MPYDIWTQDDLCQSCAFQYPGGIPPTDHSIPHKSRNIDTDGLFDLLTVWRKATHDELDEMDEYSQVPGTDQVPPLGHTRDELGEVISRLGSINLIV